jgi:UDP-N-acetylmuramoyl-L-alanyl-D-glutamate--2,6-diaminopimelate ligase
MLLSALIPHLGAISIDGPTDRPINRVVFDSREAQSADLFVAIRGERVDARKFVPGLHVAAVLADSEVSAAPGVTVIQVADARALAGNPAASMPVVGITGTNGKTTVTWMLESIVTQDGGITGVIGTTGHRIGSQKIPANHTTPEAPVMQNMLAEMKSAGCRMAAMEVSSIGLEMRRADAIPFKVGVFTSFSRDHLDFHTSMDAYLKAKARLFDTLLSPDGIAILNADEPACLKIDTKGRTTWTYGFSSNASFHIQNTQASVDGTTFDVCTESETYTFSLPLIGTHNVYNAVAAMAAAKALGIDTQTIIQGLGSLGTIPGRLEPVPNSRGITVLVDYAHTPDALTCVLGSLHGLTDGRVITVFGCGGDRDSGKRSEMGSAASSGSDHVFVTSDNPRTENPYSIIEDILPGINGPHSIEEDRAKAIEGAIALAKSGDIVLIAGKGHETTQTIGDIHLPFDDRTVAATALGVNQ